MKTSDKIMLFLGGSLVTFGIQMLAENQLLRGLSDIVFGVAIALMAAFSPTTNK